MGAEDEGRRYRAFISYSHRDAAFGRRLHRRLEAYALPRRLVGRPTPTGPAPARLSPIFRDRDELAAAHDLTEEVRAALRASDSLVVVCSPSAAASPWVAREVELFGELHPDRPILAALIEGSPAEAFPAPLRRDGSVEPLAADFRDSGDGDRLALLKLVAGIVGVGLDQLVQRDAQRRVRRVTAVTAIALSAVLAMGVLTAFALSARAEAERQRAEAEGMVEFMLTDLRSKLKGVGRLDIMGAVNDRALGYYQKQNLARLPVASLERRARLFHAMGADDETHGDHEAALAKFREARRTTAALLARAPDAPAQIFDHAQSEFWLGYVDYQRGRTAAAMPAFMAYKRLADRLVFLAPNDPAYLKEAGYAEGNLCSIALKTPRNGAVAVRHCSAALAYMDRAGLRRPDDADLRTDLANRHGWLADAYRAAGEHDQAEAEREAEAALLRGLLAADSKNMALRQRWTANRRALGGLAADAGRNAEARALLAEALRNAEALCRYEPANADWAQLRQHIAEDLSNLKRSQHPTEH